MEVQQRPDVGRGTTVDLKCIWLSGNAVSVNVVIGKEPLQLGKWDKQFCCLEGGSISSLRWSSFHRGDAGACQPASVSRGFDDLQHLCQYLWRFLGRWCCWWWWWSSVVLCEEVERVCSSRLSGLGSRWSRTSPLPHKEKEKKCWTWVTG